MKLDRGDGVAAAMLYNEKVEREKRDRNYLLSGYGILLFLISSTAAVTVTVLWLTGVING